MARRFGYTVIEDPDGKYSSFGEMMDPGGDYGFGEPDMTFELNDDLDKAEYIGFDAQTVVDTVNRIFAQYGGNALWNLNTQWFLGADGGDWCRICSDQGHVVEIALI
jgi:hypothetical protein